MSPAAGQVPRITYIVDGRTSCSEAWEAAYRAFETPEQERAKFRRRLRRLGADRWPRDAAVVELFCGSGGGLTALFDVGLTRIEGVDLSADLVESYQGPAHCYVADCRELPFADSSRDAVVVHGGLHHLESLDDLERVLAEASRVLAPDGRLCCVEPWRTPFLRFVHAVSRNPLARRLSRKLDAFETMYEHELETYERWLSRPGPIRDLLERYFEPQILQERMGKLTFLGIPRSGLPSGTAPAPRGSVTGSSVSPRLGAC